MRQFLILILILLFFLLSFTNNASAKPAQDTAHYKCTYSIQYIDDTIKMSYGRSDWYILQIADKVSYGYSYKNFFKDSLMSTPSGTAQFFNIFRKGPASANSLYGGDLMFAKVFKDHTTKTIRVRDHISTYAFIYEEDLKSQDWSIADDTITMLGYKCQKATCNFRGRDYVAWFAPDIPIGEGPWKFGGLPGLIMKIEDTKHQYIFELKSFQKVAEVIQGVSNKDATKIERKKFLSYLMGDKANDLLGLDNAKVGLPITAKKRNYDYIERDYK